MVLKAIKLLGDLFDKLKLRNLSVVKPQDWKAQVFPILTLKTI
jgi:hypothetical protein